MAVCCSATVVALAPEYGDAQVDSGGHLNPKIVTATATASATFNQSWLNYKVLLNEQQLTERIKIVLDILQICTALRRDCCAVAGNVAWMTWPMLGGGRCNCKWGASSIIIMVRAERFFFFLSATTVLYKTPGLSVCLTARVEFKLSRGGVMLEFLCRGDRDRLCLCLELEL